MSKLFPRRRHVREMAVAAFDALYRNMRWDYDQDVKGAVVFDFDFLTRVRDAMRRGDGFLEAVQVAVAEPPKLVEPDPFGGLPDDLTFSGCCTDYGDYGQDDSDLLGF